MTIYKIIKMPDNCQLIGMPLIVLARHLAVIIVILMIPDYRGETLIACILVWPDGLQGQSIMDYG